MAGRSSNKAVAVAVAVVALLALLFAAGEAKKCNVDEGTVLTQCRSCSSGTPSKGCCDALRYANFRCLCDSYWGALQGTSYARCAAAIPSACNLPNARCH